MLMKIGKFFSVGVICLYAFFGSVTESFAKVYQMKEKNPLLEKWQGPYGGIPPLDKIAVGDFKSALESAMALNLEEIDAIANHTEKPNFANTFEALEKSGKVFNQVNAIYGIWASTMADSEFQKVQEEMDPVIAAFSDKITQNAKLFARIEAAYAGLDKEKLSDEARRLAWVYHENFVRQGAKLNASSKKRVGEINQRLAALFTQFSKNLLADEGTIIYLKPTDLEGLPDSFKNAAAQLALEHGKKNEWGVLNTRSSVEPFLTYAHNRSLREKIWRSFVNRGDNGDANDNNKIITEILTLRAERAKELGFKTHAHWRLSNTMAQTPEKAMDLMMKVWPKTVDRVAKEVAEMQEIASKEDAKIKIEPWDYRYYAEKVRKKQFDIDLNDIKPYLQLDNLREGMFWVASELYGLKFVEVKNLPVTVKDMTVFEVKDKKDQHLGLWYFDPYARSSKKSGAWMSEYRTQQGLAGISPIVSNNTNFVKGSASDPVLISWDDANTLFHEFGHALHGLLSHVTYPSLAGTNTATDFVEFPSQINENWLLTSEFLQKFARHYQTNKPLPDQLFKKLERSFLFNKGFEVAEYLSAALVDMKLHLSKVAPKDPRIFENDTLKELGMPSQIVMRHRTAQFAHLFSSDAYSAGYYSYLWSEVLDHDAFEAFLEAGSAFDKKTAAQFVEKILSVGNRMDPLEAYKKFRGREPEIAAYLRSKGFSDSKNL